MQIIKTKSIGRSERISVINFVLIFALFLFFSANISQAANFSPATVQDLIADITTANTNNEDDIITLDQPTLYDIMGTETGVPFVGTGNNGLPIILPDDGSGTAHTLTIRSSNNTDILRVEIRRSFSVSDCEVNNKFRIFEISIDAELILERISMQNGCEDSGGAIYNSGKVTLALSLIENNTANNDGGGIYNVGTLESNRSEIGNANVAMNNGGGVYNLGTLDLMNESRISSNVALNNGGGVYNAADAVVMLDFGYIYDNNAPNGDGGGIYNLGTLTLMNNSYIGFNYAKNHGGGVYNAIGKTVNLISESSIIRNVAVDGNGGGIYNRGTLNSSDFSGFGDNRALNGNGGGIYNTSDGIVDFSVGGIIRNFAIDGGGVYNAGTFNGTNIVFDGNDDVPVASNNGGGIYNIGELNLTYDPSVSENSGNYFDRQTAGNLGGGIYNNGMMEITNYSFDSNMATNLDLDDDEEGGTIYNDTLGEMVITGSSIVRSFAEMGGGAIRNLGNLTAINSTISTNSTSGNGGGIKNSGELTLTNVTIANNMASEGGGIWDESMNTVNIKNSLVVVNMADVMGANCHGPISNPIGANVTDDPSCPFPVQNFDTQNMLSGLRNNNNTVHHNLIPIESNPAIDSIPIQDCTDQENPANPIEIDQSGIVRPVNFNCDSGASEFLPIISIRIKKIVSPTTDEDFSFTSSGLSGSGLCYAAFSPLTQDDFILRDYLLFDENLSCNNLPGGGENVYTITEMIPPGQKLTISCREEVDGLVTNNEAGMLTFSSLIGGGIDSVFINTLINTLANVEEATLEQCPLGGTVIQTGPDSNVNGMLDPEEIVDEFIVCDEEPGPPGPPGDDGEGFNSLTDINIEPPGPNCPDGGFRFDAGLDLNRNGILDPDEITDTSYSCNGADGPPGADGSNSTNSNCTLAGNGSKGDLSELIALLGLPMFILLGRRLRRRGVG